MPRSAASAGVRAWRDYGTVGPEAAEALDVSTDLFRKRPAACGLSDPYFHPDLLWSRIRHRNLPLQRDVPWHYHAALYGIHQHSQRAVIRRANLWKDTRRLSCDHWNDCAGASRTSNGRLKSSLPGTGSGGALHDAGYTHGVIALMPRQLARTSRSRR